MLAVIDFRDLKFLEKLGEGGSGTVHSGRWKSRDKVVAIKKVNDIDEREVCTLTQ